MAEIEFPKDPKPGDVFEPQTGMFYNIEPVKPSLAQKAFAYTTIGCIMSVLVCCTIWLCAWILQALPVAR